MKPSQARHRNRGKKAASAQSAKTTNPCSDKPVAETPDVPRGTSFTITVHQGEKHIGQ